MTCKVIEKTDNSFKLIPVKIDNGLPRFNMIEVSQWVFDNPCKVETGDIVQIDKSLLFARLLKKGVK